MNATLSVATQATATPAGAGPADAAVWDALHTLWAYLGPHGLSATDLGGLFLHFLLLSLLAIGGAITTAPGMHRYLVADQGWLTDAQFTSSIALAQAAPGPNILFVALLGWNTAGLPGLLATMAGIMLPSSALALAVARWGAARPDHPALRLITAALAPLTIGLLWSTGYLLLTPLGWRPATLALIAISLLVMLRTRWSPMWLIGLGGVVGALGWV